jgi:hypothetical protein
MPDIRERTGTMAAEVPDKIPEGTAENQIRDTFITT